MLTNRHFVAAMIVTPILSILAYFAVDFWVTIPAVPPIKGETYPLVSGSKCRYESGKCILTNGNFKIVIYANRPSEGVLSLRMVSDFPLQDAKISLADENDVDGLPRDMIASAGIGKEWFVLLDDQGKTEIRVVVAAGGNYYYGSSGLIFTRFGTGYGQDFQHTVNN
jgi:hypothetical protein